MKLDLKVILFLFLSSAVLTNATFAKDWGAVKKNYEKNRRMLLEQKKPEYKYVTNDEQILLFDSRPELGVNVHVLGDEEVKSIKQLGVRFVRFTVYWYQFQHAHKDWGDLDGGMLKNFDKKIAMLRKEGIIPLVVVHGNAKGLNFSTRKEAYKRFADFMAYMAKRYKYIRYWQLWNEMDSAFTDIFGAKNKDIDYVDRGKYYAEMLKIAYSKIKKANPKAIVVTGGMVNFEKFPVGLYEGGGKDYFDILALHTYGIPVQWSFVDRGKIVKDIMKKYGDENKPIWNSEFGVSCSSIINAWGIPEKDSGESIDKRQADMLTDCISYNKKSCLYDKIFVYAYHAESEFGGDKKEAFEKSLAEDMTSEDYGFGLTRKDGKTPRPSYLEIQKLRINSGLGYKKAVNYSIPVNGSRIRGTIKLNSAYPTYIKTKEENRVHVENGIIKRGSLPFFPLGFVFGISDKSIERAKEVGMNSIHQEYSIRNVFPDSLEEVSEKGLETIREYHSRCKKHGLVYFPLLSGHYIPRWLSKKAYGPPKDINGNDIGLWFKFSIHDPVYRETMEKFWQIVAEEVGDDPNVGAFVTWNEPAYGLDATPAALKVFKGWAKTTYKNIADFNSATKTDFKSFDSVVPPRTPDENRAYWYLWVKYNQKAFADFFNWERSVFKSVAPDANLSAKHPVQALTGDALMCNDIIWQDESQDIFGCDAYNGSLFHYRDVMEIARSFNRKGPVITYETHSQIGIKPKKSGLSTLQLFAQFIGGCRGMFFFSADQVPNFGFDNDKATPPEVRLAFTKLFKLINNNQSVFAARRCKADIAVLHSNPSTIHYGTVEDTSLRGEYTKRLSQTYDMIRNQHHAVDFISERQLQDKLPSYKLLVVPSLSILDEESLNTIADFHKTGGKIIAFAKSFSKDLNFADREVPSFLGLKKRKASPWNRSQMRLIEVAPELSKYFRTELIVQSPEIVDAAPMEQLIPGYIPETTTKSTWLAANQDAYPSIVMSTDGKVVYCAFDSLYGEGLSNLINGIITEKFDLNPEISITRKSDSMQAIEVMSAISEAENTKAIMLANTSPTAGEWNCLLNDAADGKTLVNIETKEKVKMRIGNFALKLPAYGYCVYTLK